ncbi:hypothetical protein MMC13_005897 [Lambiella insularis]|nr:hypothetical protein [Lambiella insularis]
MEVFCRHLPDHVTDARLKKAFAPVLKDLSIFTYECHKLRQGCAKLTINDAAKAQKFLDQYGQSSKGKRHPQQLKLFEKLILVSKSRDPPDEHLLRSLDEEEHRRKHRTPKAAPHPPDPVSRSFAIASLSCGLWDYNGTVPVFVNYFRHAQKGHLSFGKTSIHITMELPHKSHSRLQIEYDYSSINGSIYLGKSSNPTVTLSMQIAPRLYERKLPEGLTREEMLSIALLDMSITPKKSDPRKSEPARRRLDSLGTKGDAVASTCFTYQFVLSNASDLRLIPLLKKERFVSNLEPWLTSTVEPQTPYIDQLAVFLYSLAHHAMSYSLKFQLQRLVFNGILSPDKVTRLLPIAFAIQQRAGADRASHCVNELSRTVQYAGPEAEKSEFDIDALTQSLLSYEVDARHGNGSYAPRSGRTPNSAWIYRATVTPLGIYLYGPHWESKNRVLRSYSSHTDFFMRVDFMEENGEPIRFEQNTSLDQIFDERFKYVLQNGFNVGGRQFEFLGFSHSSLRSQSCWFVAAFTSDNGEVLDAGSIIRKLGDFSHIWSPAKCAARIGQAFSETVPSVDIDSGNVERVGDVERGGRVFSDGVGTVSSSLLSKIWEEYAVHAKVKPTVLQIRYAGVKGMVCLDTRRHGDVLMIRKSMEKFSAPEEARNIEICGSGIRPLPLRLNRQLIKILEDLGVPSQPLMSLQQEEVDELRATAQSPILAANFLEKANLSSSAMVPFLIRALVRLRLNFLHDDFLRHVIELAVLAKLRELKYRARILVKRGLTLHGIMDETGVLQEGEVYCPFIDNDTGIRRVLVGTNLVITRAPALHPGDVQLVNAVDVPGNSPLNDLHNCIVFSQYGSRDLPSMLSGGDLDGDLYNIIYDRRLRPKRVAEAADYPRVEALALDRPVERNDIIKHFLTFMQQDQLGRIATLHQAIADQKVGGTFDQECLVLAELHSTAVDYSKTGIPADISRLPKNKRIRPDFMASGPRVEIEEDIQLALDKVNEDDDVEQERFYRFYESKKVLGQLYRAINEQAFLNDIQCSVEPSEVPSSSPFKSLWSYVQKQTAGFVWEHCIYIAEEIKEIYDDWLSELMYQSSPTPWASPITELEVFIGNLVGKTHGQTKRQRETSMRMRDDYEALVSDIVSQIRNKEGGREEALERSIACMSLGLEQEGRNRQAKLGRANLLSFRWIAASVCLQEVDRLKKNRVF